MREWIQFVGIILLFAIILTGCQIVDADGSNEKTTQGDPGMEGYVVAIENGRMLVVTPQPDDFSATEGINEHFDAAWFADIPDTVKVGHEVHVWYEYMLESHPGQSSAEKVVIVSDQEPELKRLDEMEELMNKVFADF